MTLVWICDYNMLASLPVCSQSIHPLIWADMGHGPDPDAAALHGVICKFSKDALNCIKNAIDEEFIWYSLQYGLLKNTTCYCFPFEHWEIDWNSLNVAILTIPYPTNSPSI